MKKLIYAVTVLAVSTAQAATIFVDAADCPPAFFDCCSANGTPGCDDPACEAVVCAIDPFCCDNEWDNFCADEAADLCAVCDVGSGTAKDPYCSIQTAIDNAVDTDEVVVAPGTYIETINFLGKAITLRSTDPNDVGVVLNTIINGAGSGPVVTCDSSEGANTVLSGFTITGANIAGSGGGMFNSGSSPTVTNCTFSGNSGPVSFGGGGMANTGGSSPTVSNCTFSGNSSDVSGGGMFNDSSSPTVTDCTFCDNSPDHIAGDPVVLVGQIQMSTFCPIPVCPGDITGDGTVGINDFLDLLAAWGPCP